MAKTKYEEIEADFKSFLFDTLKDSTKNALDFLDAAKNNESISLAEARRIDLSKQFFKSKFMEIQGKLLSGLKCLMETGCIPRGTDHRVRPDDT